MQNYHDGAIKVVKQSQHFIRTMSPPADLLQLPFFAIQQIGAQHADMLPIKWQNGAQCCFSMFDCRLFISKFFV